MIRIDKDCYGTIATAWAISLVLIACICCFIPIKWLSIALTAILVVFMAFVTWFHRIPERQRPTGDNLVTSVADGKVVVVEEVFEKEFLKTRCMQVSVYMNFFDVHANFWPVSGKINYACYHPGKYLLAFHPKSSELNEHWSTCIAHEGKNVMFKQIAGTFARRIVCYAKENAQVEAGKQCGIIKFGSRIDMYLPLDADIKVKVGDLTRACETVIASI